MQEKKLAFSKEVLATISKICKTVFNLQHNEDILRMFGIDQKQMENVIQKITDSLPEKIFEKGNGKLMDEIKYITAREYIFFQVQEKWDDPDYKQDLKNFIHVFSRDIADRFMKEEK